MLPSFARETITRIRPATKTSRGVAVPDWEHASSATIAGCSVQPAGSSRNFTSARVLALEDAYTLFAPPGADIRPGDRVACEAGTFETDGAPEIWKSPTGRVSHIQFTLRRWEG